MFSRVVVLFLTSMLCRFAVAQPDVKRFSEKEYLEEIEKSTSKSEQFELYTELYNAYYPKDTDAGLNGLNFLLKAKVLADAINDEDKKSKVLFLLGNYFNYQGNYIKASNYYFEALKITNQTADYSQIGKIYLSLGVIYISQKKWEIAKKYFGQCIVFYKKTKNLNGITMSTPNYLIGICNMEMKFYDSALSNLRVALNHAVLEKDTNRINQVKLYTAITMVGLKQYKPALELFNEIELYLRRNTELVGLAVCLENKGLLFYNQGKYDSALHYAIMAEKITSSVIYVINKMEVELLLSKIYERLGNTKLAHSYLKKHLELKDSMIQKDITTQISLAKNNYEFEQVEDNYRRELIESTRRKNLFISIAGILGIMCLVIVFAYRGIRKERRKSEELLLNILPEETAKELKEFGKALPRSHKAVTIMFCDVQNFTVISEKMTPEALVSMLDMYFGGFDEIISKNGIEKIKTIGDAYMCAAGLHGSQPDHASRMTKTAIELMQFVASVEKSMVEKFGTSFYFRVGLHSGEVVSGVVGKKKYAYDIWGDTVNVAARMEQNSQPGHINITGQTAALLDSTFKIQSRGKIPAKNKGELEMYFVDFN